MSATSTEIRSFRNVFELERRVYRIDRLRLNPSGVPVRGIVYFLALLVGVLCVGRLPVVGWLLGLLPWYLLDLALPGAAAALLTVIRIEGRSAHLAMVALLRFALDARTLSGTRAYGALDRGWRPHELLVLVDGSDARLRRLRYSGPGAVLVAVAHTRVLAKLGPFARLTRRPALMLYPFASEGPIAGQILTIASGACLQVARKHALRAGAHRSKR